MLRGSSDPRRGTHPCCDPAGDLQLHYLGAGGWLIDYRGSRVLTAPFFSNPRMAAVVGSGLSSDTVAILDALQAALPGQDLTDVHAILVGHAHYDHLMDVPFLATRITPQARIYGSHTTRNILAAVPGLSGRVVGLDAEVGSAERDGTWLDLAPGIRAMPLESDHAPHFLGLELYEGTVDSPLSQLPERAGDWKGGQTLAFLFEFTDTAGSVAHRLFYQDSAADAEYLTLPPGQRAAGVDSAILCVPSYAEVEEHPEAAVRSLRPDHIFLGHWEDFFEDWTTAPDRSVRGTNLPAFQNRLDHALGPGPTWTLPSPGDVMRLQTSRP